MCRVPARTRSSSAPAPSALSSPLPVSLLDPWIRFFARSAGANGPLQVQVVFRGLTGNLTGLLNFGSLSPGGFANWQPTPDVLSTLALPLLTSTAQVELTSQAKSGSWQVDDLYLDPRVVKLGYVHRSRQRRHKPGTLRRLASSAWRRGRRHRGDLRISWRS